MALTAGVLYYVAKHGEDAGVHAFRAGGAAMIIVTPLGKFRSQQSEWEKSVVVTGMGAVFLAPGDAMATPGLKWMQTVMPETAWGAVFLLFGSIALLALWINGSGQDRLATLIVWQFGSGVLRSPQITPPRPQHSH